MPHPHIHGAAAVADPIPAVAGIGLRFPHHDQVLEQRPDAAWFEVHPENYPSDGAAADILFSVRERYPVSLHATGLSLGSADGVDPRSLAAIATLCDRIQPGLVSDHLSWSTIGGVHLPDLMPIPYTYEALEVFAANIDHVQAVIGRTILIENPSVYFAFAEASMSEAQFLCALVERCGCGVLLDVNNVLVSASNLGEDPAGRLDAMIDALPPQAIGEIHLAGHTVRQLDGGLILRIDDHGSPVSAEVWALYESVIRRIGARPTLIEWDTDVPDFAVLRREAATAQAVLDLPGRSVMSGRRALATAG